MCVPERTIYPARYMLQRLDGTVWRKLGNGCNVTAPLFRRRMRLQLREGAALMRVWDTRTQTEVIGAEARP